MNISIFFKKIFSLSKRKRLKFLFIISTFCLLSSCHHEIDTHNNGPISFQNGWGNDYNYPIQISLSKQIHIEDSPKLVEQFKNAIRTWNNAIGKEILTLSTIYFPKNGNNFPELELISRDNIQGIFYDKIENNAGGWLLNTRKPYTTIATTIIYADKNRIQEADIRFNRDFYTFGDLSSNEEQILSNMADFESVSLHELGHFLGLGHVKDEDDSVMNTHLRIGAYNSSNPSIKRCLSAKDIERIRRIYPGGKEPISNCNQN